MVFKENMYHLGYAQDKTHNSVPGPIIENTLHARTR